MASRKLGIAEENAAGLLARMIAEGYLEAAKPPSKLLDVGPAGSRLRNVKFLKPISRLKAEKVVSEFLRRVEDVNRRPELTHWVDEVRVFGSYLTGSAFLGDVDLAINVLRRGPMDTWDARRRRRADQSNRRFSSHLEFLSYGEREVLTILRGRHAYLSFHTIKDIEEIAAESLVLLKTTSHAQGRFTD